MRKRSQVFLADILTSLDALRSAGPDERTVVRVLGFDLREARERPAPRRVASSARHAAPTLAPTPSPAEPPDRATHSRAPRDNPPLDSMIHREAGLDDGDDRGFLLGIEPLPSPNAGEPARRRFEPLFVDRWTKAILGAAVATVEVRGEFDAARAVDTLAQGKPVTAVRRRVRTTTRRGAQVLLDMGAGMVPFADDRERLAAELTRVIGVNAIHVLRFEGTPMDMVETGADGTRRTYVPPPVGTPVVLVTDLGLGRPPHEIRRPSTLGWRAFCTTVQSAGCPLLALVPYPPDRVPPALRDDLGVVQWDRSTTVRGVRRRRMALRHGALLVS